MNEPKTPQRQVYKVLTKYIESQTNRTGIKIFSRKVEVSKIVVNFSYREKYDTQRTDDTIEIDLLEFMVWIRLADVSRILYS